MSSVVLMALLAFGLAAPGALPAFVLPDDAPRFGDRTSAAAYRPLPPGPLSSVPRPVRPAHQKLTRPPAVPHTRDPTDPLPARRTGFALPASAPTEVLRAFDRPDQPWMPGHRGVDLAASVGGPVLAAGAGTVTYSGVLAGRGVVTVTHTPTLRTTYEPVDRRVLRGTRLARGDQIGVVAPAMGHCPSRSCLHWGAISAGVYVDPMGLVGVGHPVLLPLSGSG